MQINQEIIQKIYALYDECLTSLEPFHRKLDLMIIPTKLSQKIIDATGIDTTGYWICIDNFGILHALEEHGNPISEAKRGQIAVDKDDFARMIEVCLKPDEIMVVGTSRHTQKPLLQFKKMIDNKIYVVKEVRSVTSQKKRKVNRLVFHTMYKIRAAKLS